MRREAPPSETAQTPGPPRSERPYLPMLDIARIVAVIGVVGVHVVADPVSQDRTGASWQVLRMVLATAVPIFLMMSGALSLLPAAHRRGPRDFLARRAVRIVPALAVWSAFYMLVVHRWTGEPPLGWKEMVLRIITGETFTHLYFLWAIAGLYLLAPVIVAFLDRAGEERAQGRRAWVLGLAACGWTAAVMAVPVVTDGSFEPVQQSSFTYPLLFLGYFLVGRAALAAPAPRTTAVVLLVLCVPLIALMTVVADVPDERQTWWHRVLMPAYVSPALMACSVLLFTAATSLLGAWRVRERARRVLRELGNATFGVFLVHFAILIALRVRFPALSAPESGAMLLLWTACAVASFVLALLGRRVPGLRLVL